LFCAGLLPLRQQVSQVERWGVFGKVFEDFKAEGGFAMSVPLRLEFFVAMKALAELEELAVLCGVQIGEESTQVRPVALQRRA
jgi:hypothetical protein